MMSIVNKNTFITFITFMMLFITNIAAADVYKCGTSYQAAPCSNSPETRPTKIKQIDPDQREKSLAAIQEFKNKKLAKAQEERIKEQERRAYQDAYFNALSRNIVERERQAVVNSLLPRDESQIMREIQHMRRLQGKD